jgi:hypothetical protein
VGFPYKNLGVTLAFPLHLLSPTVSDANREGRTDYYSMNRFMQLVPSPPPPTTISIRYLNRAGANQEH